MKFDDEICKGVSCPECSFNKGEDGCLLAKRIDEIEIIPEPCEDAISRQTVLDIVDSYSESQSNIQDVTQDIISDIVALPPVNPQSKMGHWIDVTNGRGGHECDLCHEYAPSYQSGDEWLTKYCPNCGAEMIAPQERSEKE